MEEDAAAAAEDITQDMPALRVTADNKLRVGASLIVGGYLGDSSFATGFHRAAIFDFQGIVEGDVLVVAASEAHEVRADGLDKLTLATGIGLVVSPGQEDVDVGARIQSRLLRGDERQEEHDGDACRGRGSEMAHREYRDASLRDLKQMAAMQTATKINEQSRN